MVRWLRVWDWREKKMSDKSRKSTGLVDHFENYSGEKQEERKNPGKEF